jgi:hypothetical protein
MQSIYSQFRVELDLISPDETKAQIEALIKKHLLGRKVTFSRVPQGSRAINTAKKLLDEGKSKDEVALILVERCGISRAWSNQVTTRAVNLRYQQAVNKHA